MKPNTNIYDFSGWATVNNLKCSDGRTIIKDAFKHNDGMTVPLVWNHRHDNPENVLGHALLENRDEGVYAYCTFNDAESGKSAKLLVEHGDVSSLSIFANQLKQNGGNVLHGNIREVSLVLAGANPGARIDSIIVHSDNGEIIKDDTEAVIFNNEESISLYHAETNVEENQEEENIPLQHAETNVEENQNEKTIKEVLDSMTDDQLKVLYALVGYAMDSGENNKSNDNKNEGDKNMKHNVFENDEKKENQDVISHSDMEAIIGDAKRYGSMKESVIQHGIDNIEYLFPDEKTIGTTPEFVKRETDWVDVVMNGVHRTPFSRIKSRYADITEDDARAKGYIKGNMKKEEFFGVAKRSTTPTTIYKKQKLDRDDIADITDFDVIAWIKGEMRLMLNEEVARAILIGDGRLSGSDDKINEDNIRPIWTDNDVFSVKKVIELAAADTEDQKSKKEIRGIIKGHKDYKGSGNPIFFTTEDTLTNMLLMEDTQGRVIYDSEEKLATALRVSKIVTVPSFENQTRTVGAATHTLLGIMVNLKDYNVGADKGGAVSMFEDFDIDYNAQKYLIETRCSGALIKPYSAVVFETKTV